MDKFEFFERIKESLLLQVFMRLCDFEQFCISDVPLFFSPDDFNIVLSQDEFNFLVEVKNAKKTNKC